MKYFIGGLVGWLIVAVLVGYWVDGFMEPPTHEELQREFDAMRMCIQTGPATGCKLSVYDFERYLELRDILAAVDT